MSRLSSYETKLYTIPCVSNGGKCYLLLLLLLQIFQTPPAHLGTLTPAQTQADCQPKGGVGGGDGGGGGGGKGNQ